MKKTLALFLLLLLPLLLACDSEDSLSHLVETYLPLVLDAACQTSDLQPCVKSVLIKNGAPDRYVDPLTDLIILLLKSQRLHEQVIVELPDGRFFAWRDCDRYGDGGDEASCEPRWEVAMELLNHGHEQEPAPFNPGGRLSWKWNKRHQDQWCSTASTATLLEATTTFAVCAEESSGTYRLPSTGQTWEDLLDALLDTPQDLLSLLSEALPSCVAVADPLSCLEAKAATWAEQHERDVEGARQDALSWVDSLKDGPAPLAGLGPSGRTGCLRLESLDREVLNNGGIDFYGWEPRALLWWEVAIPCHGNLGQLGGVTLPAARERFMSIDSAPPDVGRVWDVWDFEVCQRPLWETPLLCVFESDLEKTWRPAAVFELTLQTDEIMGAVRREHMLYHRESGEKCNDPQDHVREVAWWLYACVNPYVDCPPAAEIRARQMDRFLSRAPL